MKANKNPLPILDHRAELSSLEGIRSGKMVKRLRNLLLLVSLSLLAGLLFLPWQQFVRGSGKVVAFNPLERKVVVEAPLSGRLKKSHVVEGQVVTEGDLLFEITDNDPELLNNLKLLREAASQRVKAATAKVESLASSLDELKRALPIQMREAEADVLAAKYAEATAKQQYERISRLFNDERGLASRRAYELALLERDATQAKHSNVQAKLERIEPEAQAKIQSTRASMETAKSDLLSAQQAMGSMDIRIRQTSQLDVRAPRGGVVKSIGVTDGSFLKSSAALCVIIPDTEDRMAEIFVSGNDMPLMRARKTDENGNVIERGSMVRLQFEGWPAVQLMGWPSVARGTFGGEVILIDPSDDGKGRFRVIVAPEVDGAIGVNEELAENGWPNTRWLRQGVRVNAWVLLRRVPLWFEVWRQMNGFPPALNETSVSKEGK